MACQNHDWLGLWIKQKNKKVEFPRKLSLLKPCERELDFATTSERNDPWVGAEIVSMLLFISSYNKCSLARLLWCCFSPSQCIVRCRSKKGKRTSYSLKKKKKKTKGVISHEHIGLSVIKGSWGALEKLCHISVCGTLRKEVMWE